MSAYNFLALSLSALKSGNYEEAGTFLASCLDQPDFDAVLENVVASRPKYYKEVRTDEDASVLGDPDTQHNRDRIVTDEHPVDEELFGIDDHESTSSVNPNRRSGSLAQIHKVITAAISLSANENEGHDQGMVEDEEEFSPDPDLPGERLIPASFSSEIEIECGLDSPVTLR